MQPFELDFLISKKHVSMVNPSQEDEVFCTVMTFFLRLLLLSIY